MMIELFEISRFIDAFTAIFPFLKVTFFIVIVSMGVGTALAIAIAIVRIKKIPMLSQITGIHISFVRGTPFLVQLLIVYCGIPVAVEAIFGINIHKWDSIVFAIIAFVLSEGALLGEQFRSAIQAVPEVQAEAAGSIGMNERQTFFRIVLPQSIRTIIPAYGTELVGAFQNTAMVFSIGVMDIMSKAKLIGKISNHALDPYLVVAIIYIVLSLVIKGIFQRLDKRMQYGRARV